MAPLNISPIVTIDDHPSCMFTYQPHLPIRRSKHSAFQFTTKFTTIGMYLYINIDYTCCITRF